MKTIKLTNGQKILVSNKDYTYLKQWKWGITGGHACRTVYLHRVVLERRGIVDAKQVDHRNGNKLNNCRSNLRPATNQQNAFNQRLPKNNTSGFKGVSWSRQRKKWKAYIVKDRKQICLGFFKYKIQAARAYNKAAKKYYGKFAKLN